MEKELHSSELFGCFEHTSHDLVLVPRHDWGECWEKQEA